MARDGPTMSGRICFIHLYYCFFYYSVLKDFTEVFGRGSWLRGVWRLEVLDGYGYLLLAVRGEGGEREGELGKDELKGNERERRERRERRGRVDT